MTFGLGKETTSGSSTEFLTMLYLLVTGAALESFNVDNHPILESDMGYTRRSCVGLNREGTEDTMGIINIQFLVPNTLTHQ